MDSKTAVMTRDYGSTNMSDIPLTSSVECLRESSRIDGTVKLKPKKNDSLPRFFRRKKSDPTEFCMSTKEELKPDPRTNSLGRRIQYRIAQMRNPPGSPVESLDSGTAIETKRGSLRSALSGYWSSIFKKTPREAGEIVTPTKVEKSPTTVHGAIAAMSESKPPSVADTIPITKERTPEIPKSVVDEPDELEKAVKGTTQEVYVG